MIKTICYISDSLEHDSRDKLEALYSESKANNIKHNITGILICKNQNFLQVIEGEVTIVNEVFGKIKNDRRHKNVFEVINTTIEERVFEDYNFGFTVINNKLGMLNLNEYLIWLRSAEHELANKIITMVEGFIDIK